MSSSFKLSDRGGNVCYHKPSFVKCQPHEHWVLICLVEAVFLTCLLLNTTCPVLANSVDPDQLASSEANWSGFFRSRSSEDPDQLASDLDLHCLSLNTVCEFLSKTRIKKFDWLEIRSGCGILIYSPWQGLSQSYTVKFQWLDQRWPVYRGCWLVLVSESTGNSSDN